MNGASCHHHQLHSPRQPTNPEAAALELIARMRRQSLTAKRSDFISGLTEILQDYCGILLAEGAFTGLSWSDAKPIAAAICFDVCNRDDAVASCGGGTNSAASVCGNSRY
jgi:hypothetical protein